MKNTYLAFIIFLVSFNLSFAQFQLEIEIENLRNDYGVILLELLDSEENSIGGETGQISNRKCVIVFENLTPTKYAIRYFHDENSNNNLDLNFMGIPKEGYGMSNNAYGLFGPKDFNDWLFLLSSSTKITLRPKY